MPPVRQTGFIDVAIWPHILCPAFQKSRAEKENLNCRLETQTLDDPGACPPPGVHRFPDHLDELEGQRRQHQTPGEIASHSSTTYELICSERVVAVSHEYGRAPGRFSEISIAPNEPLPRLVVLENRRLQYAPFRARARKSATQLPTYFNVDAQ